MNTIFKQIRNRSAYIQKGQVYLLVMIFMLVGTLIVTPLLTFMSSGLSNTLKYQNRTQELYAANAGAKEAIWNIKLGKVVLSAGDNLPDLPLLVENTDERPNKKLTTVSIFCMDKNDTGGIYKITSTGSTSSTSNTTIEAWVETRPFLMDYALITPSTIDSQAGGAPANPDIHGSVAGDTAPFTGDIDGRIDPPWSASTWPFNVLQTYYWDEPGVAGVTIGPVIDVQAREEVIGPGHSDGNLTFTGNQGTLRLNGTIYVKGDLELSQNHDFTLDLNYQTIYVEGNITCKPQKPFITGSGCIIAVGDIDFQPTMTTSPDDYVFLMSANNTVNFQPNSNFYGTIAGKTDINLRSNFAIYYSPPPAILNFPGAEEGVSSSVKVISWNVSPPFPTTSTGLYIDTELLPSGVAGVEYSQNLSATGGTPGYVFSKYSGSLPDETFTIAADGTINGTPGDDSVGISAFIAKVTDSANHTALRWFSIKIESSATPDVLAVTTDIATDIVADGATLNGTLTNKGAASFVTLLFEYGLDTNYGANITGTPPTSTFAPRPFSASIHGLQGNTVYHYRAIAIGDEIKYGGDRTFQTSSSAPQNPTVDNVLVRLKNSKTFEVEGWIKSMGSATSVSAWAAMGTSIVPDDGTGTWIEAKESPLDGSPNTKFTVKFENSTDWPNGTYHFRVKLIGNNGTATVYGIDISKNIPE